MRTPLEQYFYNTFQVATEDDADAKKYTTTEIFDILRSKAGSQLRLGSLTHFGRFLAHLPNIRRYRRSCGTLYLLKRIDL